MMSRRQLSSGILEQHTIAVFEPFAEFLQADREEFEFEISLLDVVRFAGHACPSMIGAFLISKRAIHELFPDSHVLIRGEVAIDIPQSIDRGATGSISNVFSMIFGAWDQSGFPGMRGQFVRRGLLHYDVSGVPQDHYRFRHLNTGKQVDITYQHAHAPVPEDANSLPFQKVWRYKLAALLEEPNTYVSISKS